MGDKVLAIIPARGGSKRLPRKNMMNLKGKPLIQWTIDAARQSKNISTLVVSTEDMDIAALCKGLSVSIVDRPEKLAKDDSLMIDVVLDAAKKLRFCDGKILLLQPTSPFRTAEDIDNVIHMLDTCEVVVSVNEKHQHNGAIFGTHIDYLKEKLTFFGPDTYDYVMPVKRSIDIDYLEDLQAAEAMI